MRIALCGSAPASVQLAPYKDSSWQTFAAAKPPYPKPLWVEEEWEVWGCSPGLYGIAERLSRWFELHRWEPGQQWFSPEYVEWLKQFRGPLYVGRPIEELPNAKVYPLDLVEEAFSSYFLNSSLSLMMALAILEIEDLRGARKQHKQGSTWNIAPADGQETVAMRRLRESDDDDIIGLWGVDMSATEEWESQRPGCHFFILEALRRGIGVFVPPESDLLRPLPVYGICEWDEEYIKKTARARELNARLKQAQATVEATTKEALHLGGALDNLQYEVKTWTSRYGLPHGIVLRHVPGTGLGGKIPER